MTAIRSKTSHPSSEKKLRARPTKQRWPEPGTTAWDLCMKGTYIRLNEEVNFLRRSRAKEILKIEALRWRLLEHIKNIVFPAYQRAFAAIKRLRGAYYVCEEGVRVYKFTKSHFGD